MIGPRLVRCYRGCADRAAHLHPSVREASHLRSIGRRLADLAERALNGHAVVGNPWADLLCEQHDRERACQ